MRADLILLSVEKKRKFKQDQPKLDGQSLSIK